MLDANIIAKDAILFARWAVDELGATVTMDNPTNHMYGCGVLSTSETTGCIDTYVYRTATTGPRTRSILAFGYGTRALKALQYDA